MYKAILITIISIFLSVQTVNAVDLRLKSIDIEFQEAVLIDKDTGYEWIVLEGDDVEGWIVDEIKKNCVVIKKEAEGDTNYGIARKLTLPKKLSVTPVQ